MERVHGALRGVPDLAIEIVSESESAVDLDRKIHQYIQAGATAVWALYAETRHALAWHRSCGAREVGPGQVLEEPDFLPGLRIPFDDLFGGIEALAK